MATQNVIIKCLEDAAKNGDAAMLKDAYAALTMNLDTQVGQNRGKGTAGLEALVICAETALKVRFHLARLSAYRMHM